MTSLEQGPRRPPQTGPEEPEAEPETGSTAPEEEGDRKADNGTEMPGIQPPEPWPDPGNSKDGTPG